MPDFMALAEHYLNVLVVRSPSMERTPIFDSRKSNRVLGPDGLPPAPSSSSSFLDLPLPLPLTENNPKTETVKPS